MMNLFSLAISLAVVFAVLPLQRSLAAQTTRVELDQPLDVKLTVRAVNAGSERLVLEATVKNGSTEPVFVTRNPMSVNGTRGVYLSLSSDGSMLNIESRVFGLDRPSPYSDQTAVEVIALDSMEEFTETIVIANHQMETVPPIHFHQDRKRIDLGVVSAVRVSYGFFLGDSDIRGILRNKKVMTGLEPIRPTSQTNERQAYQLQRLVSNSIEIVRTQPTKN